MIKEANCVIRRNWKKVSILSMIPGFLLILYFMFKGLFKPEAVRPILAHEAILPMS